MSGPGGTVIPGNSVSSVTVSPPARSDDGKPGMASSIVEEAPQLAAARRMLELAQGLRLDLADALARHRELLADFLQRVVGVHADAKAHAQHALLARRERGQHPRRGLAQV